MITETKPTTETNPETTRSENRSPDTIETKPTTETTPETTKSESRSPDTIYQHHFFVFLSMIVVKLILTSS